MVAQHYMSVGNSGALGGDLSAESLRTQLAKTLQSRTFSQAPILSRLLRYLVEQAIQGNADQLKEYSLGVEVFDRAESFDPRTDTIVRVQARRLRSKLEEYYEAEGRADPIVIEVPKGHYVAVFRSAPPRRHALTRDLKVLELTAGPRPLPLPASRTPLIGRAQELAAVKQLLLSEHARLNSAVYASATTNGPTSTRRSAALGCAGICWPSLRKAGRWPELEPNGVPHLDKC